MRQIEPAVIDDAMLRAAVQSQGPTGEAGKIGELQLMTMSSQAKNKFQQSKRVFHIKLSNNCDWTH